MWKQILPPNRDPTFLNADLVSVKLFFHHLPDPLISVGCQIYPAILIRAAPLALILKQVPPSNKRLPQISASPQNAKLIRNLTVIFLKIAEKQINELFTNTF